MMVGLPYTMRIAPKPTMGCRFYVREHPNGIVQDANNKIILPKQRIVSFRRDDQPQDAENESDSSASYQYGRVSDNSVVRNPC